MLSILRFVTAAGGACVIFAGPALAAAPTKAVFAQCDGFGGPSGSGDGMTEQAFTWGLFRPELSAGGDTTQDPVTMGRGGLAACDQALAHPALKPEYGPRRAHLLRARAMHRLALRQTDEALADLDAAEAAVDRKDIYYHRSLGLGIDFVRAYALRQKGDAAAADEMVLNTWRRRPYSRYSGTAANLALTPDGDRQAVRTVTEGLSRVHPRSIATLSSEAFQDGRFEDVLALYDQLEPPEKRDAVQFSFQLQVQEVDNRMMRSAFWASHAGRRAYALAALGKGDEARAALTKGREDLAKAIEPSPPRTRANGKPIKRGWIDEYETKIKTGVGERVGKWFDEWSQMVELRILAETDPQAAMAGLATAPIKEAAADVRKTSMEKLKLQGSAAQGAPIKVGSDEYKDPAKVMGLMALALPPVERADQLPPFQEAKHPRFSFRNSYNDLSVEGYRVTPGEGDGPLSVRVRASEGSPAVIEEMALLRAAQVALESGKRGLIVPARRDVRHTIANTYYGVPGPEAPDGHSIIIDVLPVDPAALPEAYADAQWRVIDAQAVADALGPVYPSPAKD